MFELTNENDLEKKLRKRNNFEKKTTLKKIPTLYKKLGHNQDLNPEHHTHVWQRLKTLCYLMADPMFAD